MNDYTFTPIGLIRCKEQYKYEQPRQGTMQTGESVIELKAGLNLDQALRDLDGFDYLWLIFVFHQNQGWKPLVNPPRLTDGRKIGLFATRSPYRVNPIGMSCVKLLRIEGFKIYIQGSDLLDGTPILDIKPYIKYCDCFPDAKQGWLETESLPDYHIEYENSALAKINWLEQNSSLSLKSFLETQLKKEPLSSKRKRLKQIDSIDYQLAYRTWRIIFSLKENIITIKNLYSGYTTTEMQSEIDKYRDKNLHRNFLQLFLLNN